MFMPNLDTFRGIFGLPSQNQNESLHKSDCCKGSLQKKTIESVGMLIPPLDPLPPPPPYCENLRLFFLVTFFGLLGLFGTQRNGFCKILG